MEAISIQDGDLRFADDYQPPQPQPGEVIVAVQTAGICETDLQLVRGYMQFTGILGHEFVGLAQTGRLAGRRVVGEINCNCRVCPRCKSGLGNHCDHRAVIGIDHHDGAFANYLAVPEHNLHPVPDSLDNDQAVFAEPLAAAFEIEQQVEFQRHDRVVILGDGRLGLLCAQAVATRVDRIDAVGKHRGKLSRFASRGYQTFLLDEVCAERQYDVVIDCTGSTSGLSLAFSLVRPRGTIVMKTTVATAHQLSLAPVVIDELNLVGSRCGPFETAIRALETGSVDVGTLITHRFTLKEYDRALQTAASADAFKVVFDIGD